MNDASLLRYARNYDQENHLADGEIVTMLRVGSLRLTVLAKRRQQKVTLTDLYLAPELARNIMSYGKLERKVFGLAYDDESRVLARWSNDQVTFDVSMDHNVRYVQTVAVVLDPLAPSDVFMEILTRDEATA